MLDFRFYVSAALVLVPVTGCGRSDTPPDSAVAPTEPAVVAAGAETDDSRSTQVSGEPQTESEPVEPTNNELIESRVLLQAMVDLAVELAKQEQPDASPDALDGLRELVENGIANTRQVDPDYLKVSAKTEERLQRGDEVEDAAKRIADAEAFLKDHGIEMPALAMRLLPQHKAGTLSPVRTELLAHLIAAKTKVAEAAPGKQPGDDSE